MDRLDRLNSYFLEKERKRLDAITKTNRGGLPEMTLDEIKLSCMENGGYETPDLNDKLFLHFRGFKKIENLEPYTSCKAIWLDSNGFDKIENLGCLVELRCLYLSKNLMTKISGLDTLKDLTILDLSNNRISRIENLSCCPSLQTINLSRNSLTNPEDIAHLTECPAVNNIDLTHNRLEPDEGFFDVLSLIPSLTAASLNGNEVTRLPHFRKILIARIPKLGYLDRPVDVQERMLSEAFARGGIEAEQTAREEWREMQKKKREEEMAVSRANRERIVQEREQAVREGRSLIREFTPEERVEREREAKLAADNERKLFAAGVDKLAAKYWQLDARTDPHSNIDILDEAARQVLADEEAAEHEEESRVVELPDDDEEEEKAVNEADIDIQLEAEETAPEPVVAQAEIVEPAPGPTPEELEAIEREKREKREQQLLERREQEQRDQMVSESFAIYKRQLAAEKEGKQLVSPSITAEIVAAPQTVSSTWSAAAGAGTAVLLQPLILYWSEEMDLTLAKEIRTCLFDFDAISENIIKLAVAGKFGKLTRQLAEEGKISAEDCRLRWAALDAEQWSQQDPNVSGNVVHKICVQRGDIGVGHGAQPTFQALSSLAAGSMPMYLTPPTSFPSVSDYQSDSDDDNDDNEADEAGERKVGGGCNGSNITTGKSKNKNKGGGEEKESEQEGKEDPKFEEYLKHRLAASSSRQQASNEDGEEEENKEEEQDFESLD